MPGDTMETKNGRAMNKYGERAAVPVKSIPNGPSRADFIATRAKGGRVKKEVEKPEGMKSKRRMDKKPRKAK